jgi:CubicO group peptidase (beta-lactamase class C family)
MPKQEVSFQELRKNHSMLSQSYIETMEGKISPNETILDPIHNPSGGVFSSAIDLKKWAKALFRGDVLKSTDIMLTPSALRKHRYSDFLGYGYGIQILKEEGILEISHSGYVPGFISSMLYYPDLNMTVIVLENTSWLANDLKRCFLTDDKIREIVRRHIVKYLKT